MSLKPLEANSSSEAISLQATEEPVMVAKPASLVRKPACVLV